MDTVTTHGEQALKAYLDTRRSLQEEYARVCQEIDKLVALREQMAQALGTVADSAPQETPVAQDAVPLDSENQDDGKKDAPASKEESAPQEPAEQKQEPARKASRKKKAAATAPAPQDDQEQGDVWTDFVNGDLAAIFEEGQ